jgi:hypothetical protein
LCAGNDRNLCDVYDRRDLCGAARPRHPGPNGSGPAHAFTGRRSRWRAACAARHPVDTLLHQLFGAHALASEPISRLRIRATCRSPDRRRNRGTRDWAHAHEVSDASVLLLGNRALHTLCGRDGRCRHRDEMGPERAARGLWRIARAANSFIRPSQNPGEQLSYTRPGQAR